MRRDKVKSIKKLASASLILLAFTLFSLTPAFATSKSVEIKVSAYIAPLFELSVEGGTGGNLEFGTIYRKPNEDVHVQSNELMIKARSNMGQPYQITQSLRGPLANEAGDAFEEGALTVSAQNTKTNGSAQSAAVSTQPTVLFNSNAKGNSDTVKAIYDLKVKPNQDSGHYSTGLVYTILTI